MFGNQRRAFYFRSIRPLVLRVRPSGRRFCTSRKHGVYPPLGGSRRSLRRRGEGTADKIGQRIPHGYPSPKPRTSASTLPKEGEGGYLTTLPREGRGGACDDAGRASEQDCQRSSARLSPPRSLVPRLRPSLRRVENNVSTLMPEGG